MFTNSYSSILKAYLTYARPLLENSLSLWNPPYDSIQCKLIEKYKLNSLLLIYRCILDLKLNYTQRLRFLNINTLKSRRWHAELIMVYKLINKIVDADCGDISETYLNKSRRDISKNRPTTKIRSDVNRINSSLNFFF